MAVAIAIALQHSSLDAVPGINDAGCVTVSVFTSGAECFFFFFFFFFDGFSVFVSSVSVSKGLDANASGE
ncbi:hypothetical protein GCM10023116_20150 [Kistimonas scapharcae]|uniref:Secreted protein n=1 Tax=Kistimonas scapharcae TaxID=1036133 RepID=A0ABP8V375_9GAMM